MIKWENWPLWLKGFFIFWPSIGPAFYFILGSPEGGVENIWDNIDYQTDLIFYFIGLWAINLALLGAIWIFASMLISEEPIKQNINNPVDKKISDKKMMKLKKEK